MRQKLILQEIYTMRKRTLGLVSAPDILTRLAIQQNWDHTAFPAYDRDTCKNKRYNPWAIRPRPWEKYP